MTFCDIDSGRWIDVPANFSFLFRSWRPAKPKTGLGFFMHGFRNLTLVTYFILRVWASVHFRIQYYTTDGYFDAGHYSTFRTYILGIPMITSQRTPWYLGLVWLSLHGIQFPTDPMKDQFLSSVCVCVSSLLTAKNEIQFTANNGQVASRADRKPVRSRVFDRRQIPERFEQLWTVTQIWWKHVEFGVAFSSMQAW